MHGSARRLAVRLVLSLVAFDPSLAAAQHFPADEDLRVMLRYLVEDGETPGIVVAYMEADGATKILSYGSAGLDARPLGPKSVFEIGSINKTFTGALLAEAVRRGEAALEDPVREFLPDHVSVPSWEGREITLLDLTTHTSGLPRLPDNHVPADRRDPYADYTVEEMYEFLSNHELRREPGTEMEYSNIGVGILGHALARAAGMSFVDLVGERITGPLGMDMTGYALEGAVAEWMTRGHSGGNVVPYWFATEAIQGAGGLRSNAEDMLRYLEANLGPPESDLERSMRVAQQPHRSVGDGVDGGLGWGMRTTPDGRVISHSGGTGGFSTFMGFNPELGVGAIRLANTNGFGDDLMRDFVVRGAPLDLPEVSVDRESLAGFVGEYRFGAMPTWVRLEDEGYLTVQIPGNVRFKMYAESDTSFFVKRAPYRYWFSMGADGAVDVIAEMSGSRRSGERVSLDTPSSRLVAGNPDRDRLDDEVIARYEGSYAVDLGGRTMAFEVFGREGELYSRPEGQDAEAMVRVGEHEFALRDQIDIRVTFTMDGELADGLAVEMNGRTYRGERVP